MATILSHELQADFFELSGVKSKKEDLNQILEHASKNQAYGKKTILFLDEIHRWNKAQQDALLPFVESGMITLIGATTENPSFTINNALLSRAKVLVFEPLKESDIVQFFEQNRERIQTFFVDVKPLRPADTSPDREEKNSSELSSSKVSAEEIPSSPSSSESPLPPFLRGGSEIFEQIANLANGDLRNACNILESAMMLSPDGNLSAEIIVQAFGKPTYYDRDGEEHYNIISAVHKSLRDSDAHAACYWIQRMLVGGEDPRYIVRRMLRFASEDIGPADNNALLLANQVYDAVHKIGMPECRVFIFQLALYLAKAPKNNVCEKIDHATMKDVEQYGNLPVPMVIRNAPTKMMKELGYGDGYKYAHDHEEHRKSDGTIAVDNQHFPDELTGRKYF